MIAITVIGIILGFVLLDLAIRRFDGRFGARQPAEASGASGHRWTRPGLLSDFLLPVGYFLHAGHTWARIREEGSVRVGLDDFVPKTLGRIDRVGLPRVGTEVRFGEPLFALFQGRKHAALPSPVSGTITSVNPSVAESPDLLAKRPYEEGWVLEIRPASLSEDLPRLSIAGGAVEWLKGEIRSFRRFVMDTIGGDSVLGTTLADGGCPVSGVLEHLDTDAWQEYRRRFLKV